ncbi:uncharacterized protein B0H18DRAFT_1009172 [Fomitopsis serialis]|uniref:uncharacterized protein n=1 Tax=Fomitopsis serialis TaxID=139415 RepID=UPI002007B3F8|nr:uncharacterized protein B0H18DRAFT_1009172 [Neoantrodia serialis]KAH9925221.1 hypothetical protein B0H18DRAFT_1009172 [Neoantrodia serialis]
MTLFVLCIHCFLGAPILTAQSDRRPRPTRLCGVLRIQRDHYVKYLYPSLPVACVPRLVNATCCPRTHMPTSVGFPGSERRLLLSYTSLCAPHPVLVTDR